MYKVGVPCGSLVKNLLANAGDRIRTLGQKMFWRRKWHPTPVFLPEKSHGQRDLWAMVHGVTEELDIT